MAAVNKVILLGNLTRDPEVKYTTGGTARTTFGMAMNRIYTDSQSGERKEEVCFVDVTAFGRTGEICGEYLHKGSLLFLEGRLNFYSWETETGDKRSKLSVVAENIQLLPRGTGRAPDEERPASAPTAPVGEEVPTTPATEGEVAPTETEVAPTETEDDIPF